MMDYDMEKNRWSPWINKLFGLDLINQIWTTWKTQNEAMENHHVL